MYCRLGISVVLCATFNAVLSFDLERNPLVFNYMRSDPQRLKISFDPLVKVKQVKYCFGLINFKGKISGFLEAAVGLEFPFSLFHTELGLSFLPVRNVKNQNLLCWNKQQI